jgi:hypothetical protein
MQLDRTGVIGAVEKQQLRHRPLCHLCVQMPGHHDDALVEQSIEDAPLGPVGVGLFPAGQDWSWRRIVRR